MTPDNEKYLLYIDDTGSRDLQKEPLVARRDGMDWFGLGGILVKGEDDRSVYEAHKKFCNDWKIDYPLHSSAIRGRRGHFAWLSNPENAGYFMPELRGFMLSQPMVVTAVVIDRPGYFRRYRNERQDSLWDMDKTAFNILIERAAKFADHHGRKLEVVFEASGKREDRALVDYLRELKTKGMPFNTNRMAVYEPLLAADFQRIVLGDLHRKKKSLPQLQLADLVLFPVAKGRYQPDYRPYLDLKNASKLIDDQLPDSLKDVCGIKYSCFDSPERPKAQGNP